MSEKVIIFDTTLRDGEQSPGCTMNREEKLRLLNVLESLGVDVVEAGFPAASRGDFEAVELLADKAEASVIAGLCRAIPEEIETTALALKHARQARIHTFIATSPIHMAYKLKMTPDDVLTLIRKSVSQAARHTDDVEWSAEDASRSDFDFLCKSVETAIDSGATTINIPDTVGYALPLEYGALIKNIISNVPNSDKAIFSVHCHDDLGLATANSLAGLQNGARQVECTLNGIGERAGNAAMEEIVMAIKVREKSLGLRTDIRTTEITKASRLLSATVGFNPSPNKAIIGSNAFAHESGIHQDGVLKKSSTYEIMTPESIGLTRSSSLVLGKHSGSNAFATKLKELGYELGDNALKDAFVRFKNLADRKKEIFDDDIIALVGDELGHSAEQFIKMKALTVSSGTAGTQRATLSAIAGKEYTTVDATGNGPVDAIFVAIKKLIDFQPHLELYHVHAVTGGTDAQAEVTVRLTCNSRSANGHGTDPDTLVASAQAYIHAVNKLYRHIAALNHHEPT